MNHPSGLTPCMLWTCVSCVGWMSCQEAACMAAEQAHVRADGPLRYTSVRPALFLPACPTVSDLSTATCVWLFIFSLVCASLSSCLYQCALTMFVCPSSFFLISVTCARCILSSNSCHRFLKKTVSMRRPGACGMFSDVAQVKFCFLISLR